MLRFGLPFIPYTTDTGDADMTQLP